MAGTQDIINETQENAMAGVDASIPSGAGINSPEERDAIRKAISAKGAWSGMDVARTALMGAGLGSQTQATNPMTAFLQGVTAGLGAPAEVFRAKREQMLSAVEASPFGAVIEEANNPDNPLYDFRGLPYGLVAKAVSGIATESVKIAKQAEVEKAKADREALFPKKDYKAEQDMALDFNKLPEVAEYKGVRSAYNQMISAPLKIRGENGELEPNPAAQTAFMSGYVKMMFPQARQNEGTLSLAEVSSLADKNTIELYRLVTTGSKLDDKEIKKLMAAANAKKKSATNEYRKVADIWSDSADKRGFNSTFVLSGDTGSGESIDDIFKAISAQYPGMSEREVFAIMKAQGF